MASHHFISHSRADGADFARDLYEALKAGSPPFQPWLDRLEIAAGIDDWDDQLEDAIAAAASVLFVMTRDSVHRLSECKKEWTRALRCKRPVVPLLVHRDALVPLRLEGRQYVDFTSGIQPAALAELRRQLTWLGSPEGVLRQLEYLLADAQRALPRAPESEQPRIRDEMAVLVQQIEEKRREMVDPQRAAEDVQASIQARMEGERQAKASPAAAARSKFINPPPAAAPRYFQDRTVETKQIGDLLQDESVRLITVTGRGGVGKTAIVCRLLKCLESGQLPDDGGPLPVDGIVYLSAVGSRRVTVPHLYADLCRLLPPEEEQALGELYKNPQVSLDEKMLALLACFPRGCTVVLLDNFEDVMRSEDCCLADRELAGALTLLLNAPQHGVKVVITARMAPRDLAQVQPGRQVRLDLDQGLVSPFAENILRAMDVDGKTALYLRGADYFRETRLPTAD